MHVNDSADVLVVCLGGQGQVTVDGIAQPLEPGRVIVLPRGARRSILAQTRLLYLTAHRRQPRTFSPEELLGRRDPADG